METNSIKNLIIDLINEYDDQGYILTDKLVVKYIKKIKELDKSYEYKVDFYAGLKGFSSKLEHWKTVFVKSEEALSTDEIKSEAYKLVNTYPKSHTIEITEL